MPSKKGKAKSAATGRYVPAKRTLIYVLQQPGPGKLWYLFAYYPPPHGGVDQDGEWVTQRSALREAVNLAKISQPATVYVQRKNGQWREVRSYPAVRNAKKVAK